MNAPVTHDAPELHRNTLASAMSERSPILPSGIVLFISASIASSDAPGASFDMPAVPRMGPGAMPFTLIPRWPHSNASVRVMLSIAALAADACTCTSRIRPECWLQSGYAISLRLAGLRYRFGACGGASHLIPCGAIV